MALINANVLTLNAAFPVNHRIVDTNFLEELLFYLVSLEDHSTLPHVFYILIIHAICLRHLLLLMVLQEGMLWELSIWMRLIWNKCLRHCQG
jgi:hypothetical protein